MKRKKGEQREEGGGLACHGLRVSLCVSSFPCRGLRWVGADVPIFPAWPGAGRGVRAPGVGLAGSLRHGAGLPGQRFDTSLPVLPAQTAGFQAKPQGSVFHVATAHPPPAQRRALCQTPLTPCSLHAFAFSRGYPLHSAAASGKGVVLPGNPRCL